MRCGAGPSTHTPFHGTFTAPWAAMPKVPTLEVRGAQEERHLPRAMAGKARTGPHIPDLVLLNPQSMQT